MTVMVDAVCILDETVLIGLLLFSRLTFIQYFTTPPRRL
jgi:hypothetical protein